jgi:hypothetical protein
VIIAVQQDKAIDLPFLKQVYIFHSAGSQKRTHHKIA